MSHVVNEKQRTLGHKRFIPFTWRGNDAAQRIESIRFWSENKHENTTKVYKYDKHDRNLSLQSSQKSKDLP